jgi:hypothetical protein
MKIQGILNIHHSKRDTSGNVYWAFSYTDTETGNSVNGHHTGGESNLRGITRHLGSPNGDWNRGIHITVNEYPIREFDRMIKDWDYAGCRSEDAAQWIRQRLGLKY